MNDNPYHAPQTECKLAPSESVPTWRKVVGGLIFFSIIGPFIVAPVIYLVASLVAAFIDKSLVMLPFVDDGYERVCKAIRAEVEAKYAEQLKAGTADERKILLKKIEAEVQAVIKRTAPAGGLY